MGIYRYKAYSQEGDELAGTVEADSSREAADKLRREKLFPTDVVPAAAGEKPPWFRFGRRASMRELADFTGRLAVLTGSGCALHKSLLVLGNEMENRRLGQSILEVREEVGAGIRLSQALGRRPGIFPELCARSVEAGEAGGSLDAVLLRLSAYFDARARYGDQARTALLYPAFTLAVGAAVLFFLFAFVLPKITHIFQENRQALPLVTTVLLYIVGAVKKSWVFAVPGLVLAAFGASKYYKTKNGRSLIHGCMLRLTPVGRLIRKYHLSSFANTMGSLLASGIPIIQALDLSKKSLDFAPYEDALDAAARDLAEGASLSMSLRKYPDLFPGSLIQMIETGERSGRLADLLLSAAESWGRDFQKSVSRALSLLEPMMILIMGAVIAFIVLAVILPIFELNQMIR